MRAIFRVRVDCVYERAEATVTERRVFVVEALNGLEARRAAVDLAETTVACGERCVGVEWRGLEPISLPVEIVAGAMVQPNTFRALHKEGTI